jgi:hypothetical protein
MRGDLVHLNFKAFIKQYSGLIVKCLEIPHIISTAALKFVF